MLNVIIASKYLKITPVERVQLVAYQEIMNLRPDFLHLSLQESQPILLVALNQTHRW